MFFHLLTHRCKIWYLKLIKKYIMKQISIVWILRCWTRMQITSWFDNIIVFQNFQILFATSMNRYLCNLIVKNSYDMSTMWNRQKMIEKSIRKKCIDVKNANSNFSILIKFCQKIKSINMRKNQIFSTLFVFLDRVFVFLDRVSVLQNRICNIIA